MSEMIRLKADDGFELGGYEVRPEGEPKGGVVILQEIFGVNDHIKRVADGYAEDGYHVIAPAIFDRAERDCDLGYDKPDMDKGVALRNKIPTEATILDLRAAVEALQPSGKVALIGYCWGGSLAWFAAARVPGLTATVGYYGGMIAKNLGETPRVPVMLHFGEKDGGIPMTDVEKIKADTDPSIVQIFTYPAGHAFNRDGTPVYQDHCAMLARMRTVKFLQQHVG
jgi:carboxymethylenebutenolidase